MFISQPVKETTLYIGATQDLLKRVDLHKKELLDGFTKKYNVKRLVYYEVYQDIKDAILREKRLKKWKRKWKIKLIEERNPNWEDLYYKLTK